MKRCASCNKLILGGLTRSEGISELCFCTEKCMNAYFDSRDQQKYQLRLSSREYTANATRWLILLAVFLAWAGIVLRFLPSFSTPYGMGAIIGASIICFSIMLPIHRRIDTFDTLSTDDLHNKYVKLRKIAYGRLMKLVAEGKVSLSEDHELDILVIKGDWASLVQRGEKGIGKMVDAFDLEGISKIELLAQLKDVRTQTYVAKLIDMIKAYYYSDATFAEAVWQNLKVATGQDIPKDHKEWERWFASAFNKGKILSS